MIRMTKVLHNQSPRLLEANANNATSAVEEEQKTQKRLEEEKARAAVQDDAAMHCIPENVCSTKVYMFVVN